MPGSLAACSRLHQSVHGWSRVSGLFQQSTHLAQSWRSTLMTLALGRVNVILETDKQGRTLRASEPGKVRREWENRGLRTQGGLPEPTSSLMSGPCLELWPYVCLAGALSAPLGHNSSLHLFKLYRMPDTGMNTISLSPVSSWRF